MPILLSNTDLISQLVPSSRRDVSEETKGARKEEEKQGECEGSSSSSSSSSPPWEEARRHHHHGHNGNNRRASADAEMAMAMATIAASSAGTGSSSNGNGSSLSKKPALQRRNSHHAVAAPSAGGSSNGSSSAASIGAMTAASSGSGMVGREIRSSSLWPPPPPRRAAQAPPPPPPPPRISSPHNDVIGSAPVQSRRSRYFPPPSPVAVGGQRHSRPRRQQQRPRREEEEDTTRRIPNPSTSNWNRHNSSSCSGEIDISSDDDNSLLNDSLFNLAKRIQRSRDNNDDNNNDESFMDSLCDILSSSKSIRGNKFLRSLETSRENEFQADGGNSKEATAAASKAVVPNHMDSIMDILNKTDALIGNADIMLELLGMTNEEGGRGQSSCREDDGGGGGDERGGILRSPGSVDDTIGQEDVHRDHPRTNNSHRQRSHQGVTGRNNDIDGHYQGAKLSTSNERHRREEKEEEDDQQSASSSRRGRSRTSPNHPKPKVKAEDLAPLSFSMNDVSCTSSHGGISCNEGIRRAISNDCGSTVASSMSKNQIFPPPPPPRRKNIGSGSTTDGSRAMSECGRHNNIGGADRPNFSKPPTPPSRFIDSYENECDDRMQSSERKRQMKQQQSSSKNFQQCLQQINRRVYQGNNTYNSSHTNIDVSDDNEQLKQHISPAGLTFDTKSIKEILGTAKEEYDISGEDFDLFDTDSRVSRGNSSSWASEGNNESSSTISPNTQQHDEQRNVHRKGNRWRPDPDPDQDAHSPIIAVTLPRRPQSSSPFESNRCTQQQTCAPNKHQLHVDSNGDGNNNNGSLSTVFSNKQQEQLNTKMTDCKGNQIDGPTKLAWTQSPEGKNSNNNNNNDPLSTVSSPKGSCHMRSQQKSENRGSGLNRPVRRRSSDSGRNNNESYSTISSNSNLDEENNGILTMANRIDSSKQGVGVDDPSCIEGTDDASYWKRVRGEKVKSGSKGAVSVRRKIDKRKMTGMGQAIKCRNNISFGSSQGTAEAGGRSRDSSQHRRNPPSPSSAHISHSRKSNSKSEDSDENIFAMADRLVNTQELEDPSVIEGATDSQYWKSVRGKNGKNYRRQLRGSGHAIRLLPQQGGDATHDAVKRRSKRRSSKKGLSEQRKIAHENRQQIRLHERSNDQTERIEYDSGGSARVLAIKGNSFSSECGGSSNTSGHSMIRNCQRQQPLQKKSSFLGKLKRGGKKRLQSSSNSSRKASNALYGANSSAGSLRSLSNASESRSTRSGRSNRTGRSVRSVRSVRSGRSAMSNMSAKSVASRPSVFSAARSACSRKSAKSRFSWISKSIDSPKSSHSRAIRSMEMNENEAASYSTPERTDDSNNGNDITSEDQQQQDDGRSIAFKSSCSSSNTSHSEEVGSLLSTAASLVKHHYEVPLNINGPSHFTSLSFDDFSSCDSSSVWSSSDHDCDTEEGDSFKSRSEHSHWDDDGNAAVMMSVADAVRHMNKQSKLERVAAAASGLRHKIIRQRRTDAGTTDALL